MAKLEFIYYFLHKLIANTTINRIYNEILDRDWFSARLFVT